MLNLNGVILSSLLLRFTLLNTPTNAQAVEVDSSLGRKATCSGCLKG
ncbi:hypothetical protein HanRHA438_Chr11g0516551 [Helianthus annuus]|nr:hypothetical protein HanRHA438_Chr11g0516551 [Helianthus annuus]